MSTSTFLISEADGFKQIVRLTADETQASLRFILLGPGGAVEFTPQWIFGCSRVLAGVEYHWRAPVEKAHHAPCWVLEGPCCHDGTSMWAMDHWMPNFAMHGADWVWRSLRDAYDENIAPGLPDYLTREPAP